MRVLTYIIVFLMVISCDGVDKEFRVSNDSVGFLTKGMNIRQLDSIYMNDSLVKTTLEGEFRYASDERFKVYEKGKGVQLLELVPSAIEGSKQQYIVSIEMIDNRYRTEEKISLKSSFKEVKKAYKSFDLDKTLKSVIVTPKGKNFYFVYKKSDLRQRSDDNYEIGDIPNGAKMERFMINWSR